MTSETGHKEINTSLPGPYKAGGGGGGTLPPAGKLFFFANIVFEFSELFLVAILV